MTNYSILPSDEPTNMQVGEILDAHAQSQGLEFRRYCYHIEQDGMLLAGITAWAIGSDVHIDTLAVDKSQRRQGLGSALMAYVEERARQDGCTTASVDTFTHQAPDYYPRLGYEVIFRYPLDDGTERVYFSKRL